MPARKPVAKSIPKGARKSAKARSKVGASGGKHKAASRARKAAKVVAKVIKSAHSEADLFAELGKLARYIQDARKEIVALQPHEVKDKFLPSASDELDAIVGATADATNAIMDATEIIEDVMGGLKGKRADQLMEATTAIYEACTFQDITGQRITRVVATLQDIETKVDGLLSAFGTGNGKARKTRAKPKKPGKIEITDADLLNGPQDAGTASTQAEIDALLASFD
ncbi:MAG TPA: chemotaxis protein CheZ [Rhodospirillales bacterium]|nr:chemotaxis protein CheZ [Rhodospirillales bacterium]